MLGEEELREMEHWAEEHHGFDPVDSVKLIAEVRRLRATNAKLLAACWYCRDWVAIVEELDKGIALVDWISLKVRLEDAVAGTAADPGREEVEAWRTGSG